MPTIQWLDAVALGESIPDFGRLSFAFSPDYLEAVAARRRGQAGAFLIEVPGLRGLVPMVMYRRAFLRIATIVAAPAAESGRDLTRFEEQQVLDALAAYLGSSHMVHRLSQPSNWALFQTAPAGSVSAPFGSYRLSLHEGEARVWQGLHQKHRNAIRHADNLGVVVKFGEDQLDNCFSLYRATMQRNALAHEPREFLESMSRSRGFHVACGVAYVGDDPVAALFAPYNHHAAYYLFGGTAEKIPVNGANNLLHYEAIKSFIHHGCDHYDFVGARVGVVENQRLAGIQRFKARFGAELKRGVLWKQDFAPAHCHAFDTLMTLRSRAKGLPQGRDIIDQERTASCGGNR